MKKIFMLLAVAGMFGMTSCGGEDVCDCLKKLLKLMTKKLEKLVLKALLKMLWKKSLKNV